MSKEGGSTASGVFWGLVCFFILLPIATCTTCNAVRMANNAIEESNNKPPVITIPNSDQNDLSVPPVKHKRKHKKVVENE